MARGTDLLKVLGLVGIGLVAVTAGPKLIKRAKASKGKLSGMFDSGAQLVDHRIGWDKLPPPLGLATLAGIRNTLRKENLYDTAAAPSFPVSDLPMDERYLTARTPDGTFNDLSNPRMGAAGTRFGRNFPIEYTHPEPEPAIMSPNPRTVSRELLTRHKFAPATTLNVLAAAWLQFMIHDWFSHGSSPKENPWQVPLNADDDWHENPMTILRTRPDPTRIPGSESLPPTYINVNSHWWDGSQVYGSTKEIQAMLRSGVDGKLKIAPNGLIPMDRAALSQPGAWLGLALLINLF